MNRIKFTMIEMVIVVAILLFLTAGLFALGNVLFKKYYLMQGKMEFLKIQNGISLYKSAVGDYPPDYMSSSQNENGNYGSVGRWQAVAWKMDQRKAKDYYDKFSPPSGCPKALVKYLDLGHTYWGVWVWGWGDDIGGELPVDLPSGGRGGYVCQNKKTVDNSVGGVVGFFGRNFPNPASADGSESSSNYYYKVISVDEAQAINVQYCGSPNFVCGTSNPNDVGNPSVDRGECFSCGWHNKASDIWEGSYDTSESSKAIYDFLCRPMKGRMREGVAINPKYENAKPFIEVSNKLIRPAGKAPPFQCDGTATINNAENYKRWGEGLFNQTDSFEVIDVWGKPYLFVSSANEYTTPTDNKVPPYKAFWLTEFGSVEKAGFQLDIFPPYYNPGSYDLGSSGPDMKTQNWIPKDFKLSSPSGYAKNLVGGSQAYIFGQTDDTVEEQTYFFVLPSEDLKETDYDNDNLNNFSQNPN